MSRIVFTGIVLELVLLSGITEATCCHEIKNYVENRTVASNLSFCRAQTMIVCEINCCRVIEEDIRKQTQAYRTICPGKSQQNKNFISLPH